MTLRTLHPIFPGDQAQEGHPGPPGLRYALIGHSGRAPHCLHGMECMQYKNWIGFINAKGVHPELDFILLDGNEPQQAVLAMATSIRRQARLKELPVFVMDELPPRHMIPTYLQHGVDDVVNGSWSEHQFRTRIKHLRERDRQRQISPLPSQASQGLPTWKRMMDVVLGSILLLLSLPVLIACALCILAESPGRILESTPVVGRNYRIFSLWRMRTRRTLKRAAIIDHQAANQFIRHQVPLPQLCPRCKRLGRRCSHTVTLNGVQTCEFWKGVQEMRARKLDLTRKVQKKRITRVGAFMERTGFHKLPSLFNVISGDMSLVGNRPLPLDQAQLLTRNSVIKRFLAPMGLTGSWFLSRSEQDEESLLGVESRYHSDMNPLRDLSIILKSIVKYLVG